MTEKWLFLLFILGTILLTIFAISIAVLLFIHKQRQVRHKTDLLKTRLEEQEQSMTLISEEIHDNVGQVLGLARMYIHNLSRQVTTPEGEALSGKINDLMTKAITDLRHISHSLNSDLLEKVGLAESMEREVYYLHETSDINSDFHKAGEVFLLNREQNLLVFRIVQETLQNIVKHAGATRVSLGLEYTTEAMVITIEDNGKGFDTEEAENSHSLGFRNMKNRAKLLKAQLDITSEAGKGSLLKLNIPRVK